MIARCGETTHPGVDVNNIHLSMINPLTIIYYCCYNCYHHYYHYHHHHHYHYHHHSLRWWFISAVTTLSMHYSVFWCFNHYDFDPSILEMCYLTTIFPMTSHCGWLDNPYRWQSHEISNGCDGDLPAQMVFGSQVASKHDGQVQAWISNHMPSNM